MAGRRMKFLTPQICGQVFAAYFIIRHLQNLLQILKCGINETDHTQ